MMLTEQITKETIIRKAWSDPTFNRQLNVNPKAALKEAFGIVIPDNIEVTALEENPNKFYLVIPANPEATKDTTAEMW